MKNKKSTKNSNKNSSNNSSTSSASKPNKKNNISQKTKTKSNTSNTNTININNNNNKIEQEKNKEKIILDFKEILKPSLNQNINYNLYLELMNNLDKKDDLKTLAICRLILSEDPNNEKIKELHDLIYEDVKQNYYENGQLEKSNDEKMDKHMKLNADGEYEYCFSDESDED